MTRQSQKLRRPSTLEQLAGNPELAQTLGRAVIAEQKVAAKINARQTRQTPMFAFSQEVRAFDFEGCDEFETAEVIDIVFAKYNYDWSQLPYSDARADFIQIYPVVQFPANLFAKAVALAKRHPFHPHRSLSPRYDDCCSICRSLQKLAGDEPFIFSQMTIANAIGTTQQQVSNYRKQMVHDGLLVIVEEAVPPRRAARAKFVGSSCTKVSDGIRRTLRTNKVLKPLRQEDDSA